MMHAVNFLIVFWESEKFSTTYALVPFSSRPFYEKFKFLKKCPYDFYKI